MPNDFEKYGCGARAPERGLPWDLHREQMYTYYYMRLGKTKGVPGVSESKVYAERDALFHARLGNKRTDTK